MKNSNEPLALSKDQIDSVVTLYSNGQYQEAIDKIKTLNENYPNVPLLFNLIGACYKALGELEGASQMFEKAITLKPDYAEAHNNLGATFKDLGRLDDAFKCFKKAISLKSGYVDAHYNLAIMYQELEQFQDSVESFLRAISLNPNYADAHINLGISFKALDRQDDAIKSFERAISLNPYYAKAHNNLGGCLQEIGKFNAAIQSLEKAISIDPNFAEAHNNLGFAYFKKYDKVNAIKSYKKAIAIQPSLAEAHDNLGNSLMAIGQLDKALESYERAISINPDLDYLLGSRLSSKMNLCIWSNLLIDLKEVIIKTNSGKPSVTPFDLMGLVDDPKVLRQSSEIYSSKRRPKSYALADIKPYPKHKKIRIGYFSSDFKIHPVANLTAGLYELHNREHFEVHAFSLGPDTNDEMNLRIKAGVDHFHDVRLMSHKEIALLARSLEIDIAVDLAGYTAKSRTDVFAMSAAPIQLSYIGFLGTMGADYYDYLIADPIMIPEKNQKDYSEKIVYLPNFQVNDSKDSPPKITLTRKELGLPEKGFVFCCFNNTYKFTPSVFDSWARILKQVDGSVLIIYANNDLSKANLVKEITLRGIEPSRLIFGDSLPRPEYLARYKATDLFLDTTPYNAGTTASDALRMGLPVLTCIGKSYSARMGASILSSLNLPELITTTSKEYETLAVELATNPEKFKALKDKLTSNLSTAPLFDTSLFTRNIESAYTTMYERHRQGLEADHIYVEHSN